MIDLNRGSGPIIKPTDTGAWITDQVDALLTRLDEEEPEREYLGGSRLGASCERMLQYEYGKYPKDPGRTFSGELLRSFAVGHVFEDLMIQWLRQIGFTILTEKPGGGQFGFSTAGGRIKGHVDGVIIEAPIESGVLCPALFENKALNNRTWGDISRRGVSVSKPVYAGQIATYQAYLEPQFPGLSSNPALFCAINKNTSRLHLELVPFDAGLAQRMSDRGARILKATDCGERLPRIGRDENYFECRW